MITTLLAREATAAEREVERYGAWKSALLRLADRWAHGGCRAPDALPALLADVPVPQRRDVLSDLIALHLRLSWRPGPGPRLEAYAGILAWNEMPASLAEEELLARYAAPHGDEPPLDDWLRRFPGRADIRKRVAGRLFGSGRFLRLRRLGGGAGGDVWEAFDRHHRRAVAVKAPREGAWADPLVRRSFWDEAHVLSTLDGAGVPSLHEACEPPDAPPFLVLRIVRGPTLADRIRNLRGSSSHGPSGPLGALLRPLLSVCGVVSHAHRLGVVHRDIKPGNIMLGEFEETVLIDWGLAGPLSKAPQAAARAGTPEYMPPERLDGIADERGDVFGLGAVLFEILAGCPPHAWPGGDRPADWTARVRAGRPPAPRRLRPDVPPALERVCLKALARDPRQRHPGAAAFAEDLRAAVAAHSASASRRGWRWLSARFASI